MAGDDDEGEGEEEGYGYGRLEEHVCKEDFHKIICYSSSPFLRFMVMICRRWPDETSAI